MESSSLTSNFGSESSKKYKEIISTLPKLESPYPSHEYYQYQGFYFRFSFLESTLFLQEHFKAGSSNIFICSSQKTGTTWLKSLAFSIMTRDCFDESTNPLLTKVPHECIPNLEFDVVRDPLLLDTPLLSTHLPYSCLPPSIVQSNCKIIYICREPKDTFVSLWHFRKRLAETIDAFKDSSRFITLEQEFKWFCEGKSLFGPYWDHVLEYWKASLERPEKVFFLKYEDLKSDTLRYVKQLAEFMGKRFLTEEEDQGVAEKIVERCRFESLSNLEVNKSGSWTINNNAYFRKGETGDWKNHLTEDMAKLMDHITHEKFHSLGLTFPVSTYATD